jgi:hypothetical protein
MVACSLMSLAQTCDQDLVCVRIVEGFINAIVNLLYHDSGNANICFSNQGNLKTWTNATEFGGRVIHLSLTSLRYGRHAIEEIHLIYCCLDAKEYDVASQQSSKVACCNRYTYETPTSECTRLMLSSPMQILDAGSFSYYSCTLWYCTPISTTRLRAVRYTQHRSAAAIHGSC